MNSLTRIRQQPGISGQVYVKAYHFQLVLPAVTNSGCLTDPTPSLASGRSAFYSSVPFGVILGRLLLVHRVDCNSGLWRMESKKRKSWFLVIICLPSIMQVFRRMCSRATRYPLCSFALDLSPVRPRLSGPVFKHAERASPDGNFLQ